VRRRGGRRLAEPAHALLDLRDTEGTLMAILLGLYLLCLRHTYYGCTYYGCTYYGCTILTMAILSLPATSRAC
jgi:hypothetical protein